MKTSSRHPLSLPQAPIRLTFSINSMKHASPFIQRMLSPGNRSRTRPRKIPKDLKSYIYNRGANIYLRIHNLPIIHVIHDHEFCVFWSFLRKFPDRLTPYKRRKRMHSHSHATAGMPVTRCLLHIRISVTSSRGYMRSRTPF